jgi:hypothetical protein
MQNLQSGYNFTIFKLRSATSLRNQSRNIGIDKLIKVISKSSSEVDFVDKSYHKVIIIWSRFSKQFRRKVSATSRGKIRNNPIFVARQGFHCSCKYPLNLMSIDRPSLELGSML